MIKKVDYKYTSKDNNPPLIVAAVSWLSLVNPHTAEAVMAKIIHIVYKVFI